MPGLERCSMCMRTPDVDDATCPCRNGYMNEEGTFIAGSRVTSGQVLSRDDYEQHKPCETCERDPSKCQRRKSLLLPSKPRRLEDDEHEGYVEFWIPQDGISHKLLKQYLEVNAGKYAFCRAGKRFKRVEGFTVGARFRFNSEVLRELRELTVLEQRVGHLSTEELTRKVPLTKKPFTEFTRYIDPDSRSAISSNIETQPGTRNSGRSERVPQQDTRGSARSPRSSYGSMSRTVTTESEAYDEIPQLTKAARHLSIADQSRRGSSPSEDSRSRHSRDDVSAGERPQYIRRDTHEAVHYDASQSRSSRHADGSQGKNQPNRGTSFSTSTRRHQTQSPSRKAAREETREDETQDVSSPGVKFFIPSDGIDLVVFAFYLKHFVDSSLKIQQTVHNSREGYMIQAKRAITRDELEDVIKDTRSWQRERRSLPSSASYVDSKTASERLEKSEELTSHNTRSREPETTAPKRQYQTGQPRQTSLPRRGSMPGEEAQTPRQLQDSDYEPVRGDERTRHGPQISPSDRRQKDTSSRKGR